MSPESTPAPDPASLVTAFLKDRSYPCPRCNYDLRNIPSAVCPECAEPLELIIRPRTPRFGWLIVAMAPGCFSGVMAVFVFVIISINLWMGTAVGRGIPYPIFGADAFGFLSAASVGLMYRHRRRIMSWSTRRQATFAGVIWGAHVVALGLYLLAMWLTA